MPLSSAFWGHFNFPELTAEVSRYLLHRRMEDVLMMIDHDRDFIDVADEAERDVVVFGIDPARSGKTAALEREGGLDVVGDFEAGKEPGQRTRLQ